MGADGVHGAIGKAMGRRPEIVSFDDFVEICTKASKNIRPVIMGAQDFYEIRSEVKRRGAKKCEIPTLQGLSEVRFAKGSNAMYYRKGFDSSELTKCEFLNSKFDPKKFPSRKNEVRGIPPSKKQGIIKLLNVVPPAKRKFWLDLEENASSKDLVSCRE